MVFYLPTTYLSSLISSFQFITLSLVRQQKLLMPSETKFDLSQQNFSICRSLPSKFDADNPPPSQPRRTKAKDNNLSPAVVIARESDEIHRRSHQTSVPYTLSRYLATKYKHGHLQHGRKAPLFIRTQSIPTIIIEQKQTFSSGAYHNK